MTINETKSDIAKVRDEMTLDRSDGKYLNTVASNLGLSRPPYGFSDDEWRAIVKIIALQYKQIKTKMEAVLEVILGPRFTQVSALAVNADAGDTKLTLVSTDHLPQVGTMVIDEGLASEEEVHYGYIDKYSNTVYLDTELLNAHTAVNAVWESGVISDFAPAASFLNVFDSSGFPDPAVLGQYTVVIGRGTEYEFAGPLLARDLLSRKLQVSLPPLGGTGAKTILGSQTSMIGTLSEINSYYLTMQDNAILKEEGGWLQSGALSAALTTTAGSTTTVTVAGPLTANKYGGFWIVFTGNITAALRGKVGFVQDNTATVFTLGNTLPTPPVAGDTFNLLDNFQYIRATEDNTVLRKMELPDLRRFPASSQFSLIQPTTTVAIAQIQVKGVGWEVIQSDPDHVEILLPPALLESDLRSASYIRDALLTAGSSTTSSAAAIGDTVVYLTNNATFSVTGTALDSTVSDYFAYTIPNTVVDIDYPIGATSISVESTASFPATGNLRYGASTTTYLVAGPTTLTVGALPAALRQGTIVRDTNAMILGHPLAFTVGAGDTVVFHPDYDDGNYMLTEAVWPGPYVWSLFDYAHKKETIGNIHASTTLAGPTFLSIDKPVNSSILEVEDASAFSTTVPYNILVGENSGNVETLAVQQLSLKSRTYNTLSGPVAPGAAALPLTATTGPVGPAHTFPNAGPYRVVVSPFTASAEVVEVASITGTTLNLTLGTVTANSHLSSARVVLLSDLLRVSPATGDDHAGNIAQADRFKLYAPITGTGDLVRPIYTSITVTNGTDFATTNGEAVINFGKSVVNTSTTISLFSSPGGAPILLAANANPGDFSIRPTVMGSFPSTFPYYVTLVDGITNEQILVTSKDATFLYTATPVVNTYLAGPGTVAITNTFGTLGLTDTSKFPTSGYPYVVYVDVGGGPLLEEALHVTNNNTGTNTLTLSHIPVFTHVVGRRVDFRSGKQEQIEYTTRVGTTLSFASYLLIDNTHYLMEGIAPTVGTGHPRVNGYDFPFRLPLSLADKIKSILDLIRAAGVKLTFIDSK
jgi:hypothetical protein